MYIEIKQAPMLISCLYVHTLKIEFLIFCQSLLYAHTNKIVHVMKQFMPSDIIPYRGVGDGLQVHVHVVGVVGAI